MEFKGTFKKLRMDNFVNPWKDNNLGNTLA